ncbi:MAG: hypothetical protein M3247_09105 [Thermoproteota archaeon]|nr:hypothetical protein [Thermoproteota archaeon]
MTQNTPTTAVMMAVTIAVVAAVLFTVVLAQTAEASVNLNSSKSNVFRTCTGGGCTIGQSSSTTQTQTSTTGGG